MARALAPGGRFVAELGGRGNIRSLLDEVFPALEQLGVTRPERLSPWYFPSLGEYAALLDQSGLEVRLATLFDRPARLDGGRDGLRNWFRMFGQCFTSDLSPADREAFLDLVEARAAAGLLRDGVWTVDYRRLRVLAVKL